MSLSGLLLRGSWGAGKGTGPNWASDCSVYTKETMRRATNDIPTGSFLYMTPSVVIVDCLRIKPYVFLKIKEGHFRLGKYNK